MESGRRPGRGEGEEGLPRGHEISRLDLAFAALEAREGSLRVCQVICTQRVRIDGRHRGRDEEAEERVWQEAPQRRWAVYAGQSSVRRASLEALSQGHCGPC